MRYLKIINLLDDTGNQTSKSRTRKWGDINNELPGTYNAKSDIKFKISILRSNLCDYSDYTYLLKEL